MRESNPRLQLGRLRYYHYTNPAYSSGRSRVFKCPCNIHVHTQHSSYTLLHGYHKRLIEKGTSASPHRLVLSTVHMYIQSFRRYPFYSPWLKFIFQRDFYVNIKTGLGTCSSAEDT